MSKDKDHEQILLKASWFFSKFRLVHVRGWKKRIKSFHKSAVAIVSTIPDPPSKYDDTHKYIHEVLAAIADKTGYKFTFKQ